MAENISLTLILVFFSFFALILTFFGIAALFGGEWETIATDLVQFMPYIVVLFLAFFGLVLFLGRR